MKRVLIIAGHEGALGREVYTVLNKKNFTKIILLSDQLKRKLLVSGQRPDLADPSIAEELFDSIEPSKDTQFYLFSSVGGFTGGKTIWDADSGDALSMMQKNFLTSYNLLRQFSKLVAGSHGGAAVFVSAWSATNPEVNRAAYSASKAALNHLIEVAAQEGKGINLSINGIAPFLIDTPANREWMPEEKWGTMQKPDEIGEFVFQIFNFAHIFSGNIIDLGERFQLLNFSKSAD